MRETTVDVSGQEIMTSDKVSLRMNALVTYRITDARKTVISTDDVRQALYRETQLALRAIVGGRELDAFLTDKDAVAREIEQAVRRRADELGLGGRVGRYPGRDPARRHEGHDEQSHGSQEGRRDEPHLAP